MNSSVAEAGVAAYFLSGEMDGAGVQNTCCLAYFTTPLVDQFYTQLKMIV